MGVYLYIVKYLYCNINNFTSKCGWLPLRHTYLSVNPNTSAKILNNKVYWIISCPKVSTFFYCNSWAKWIRKIYETAPLTCSSCGESMRIIAFITDPREVVKILPRSTIERGKGTWVLSGPFLDSQSHQKPWRYLLKRNGTENQTP